MFEYKPLIAPTIVTGILSAATILLEKYTVLGWGAAIPVALLGGLVVACQYFLNNQKSTKSNGVISWYKKVLIPGSLIKKK